MVQQNMFHCSRRAAMPRTRLGPGAVNDLYILRLCRAEQDVDSGDTSIFIVALAVAIVQRRQRVVSCRGNAKQNCYAMRLANHCSHRHVLRPRILASRLAGAARFKTPD
jgi:hypothetical protein